MTEWMVEHKWVTFLLIYIFLLFVYTKVFRMRRLPILKQLIVWLVIAMGAFILLLFQVDLGLPVVYSLGVAVLLMLTVRIRYFIEGRKK